MNILLVFPEARSPSVPPLGLAYVASFLRIKGHSVEVLDLAAHPLGERELDLKIKGFARYDCIGISAIVTAYNFVKVFSKKVKTYFPQLPVIVGNTISMSCPKTLLENSDADVVVVDEGELTAAELIENIKRTDKFKDIRGICYKQNGNVYMTTTRNRIEDLDKLPFPAWDLLDMDVYMNNTGLYLDRGMRVGWVSAVRGCPYSCGYCSRGFGRKITSRSADSLIDEIAELKKRYKVKHIDVVDDLFMANKRLVSDFSRRLTERGVNITWRCTGRVNLIVDEGLLRAMRRSGCISINYGLESGSQKILDNMNKCATIEQAKNAFRMTRRAGMEASGSLMFGYVGEDLQTIKETVDFVRDLELMTRRLFFSTPYPGTALYEWAVKNNRIKCSEDEYLSRLGNNAEVFLVNLTEFSDEEIVRLKNEAEKTLNKNSPLSVRIADVMQWMYFIRARIKTLGVMGVIKKAFNKI